MVWPWSSTPKSTGQQPEAGDSSNQARSTFALTEEQRTRIFGGLPSQSQPKATRTQEEQADAEVAAFLKTFEGAASNKPQPTSSSEPITQAHPTEPTPAEKPDDHDRILPDGTLNIHPSAIYPRTMSCRETFDNAFYCHSLGGKFNDVYRYGHLKDCSEQWGAFWFCMRINTLPDRDKQRMVRDYYAARDERRRKEFGSSEDVWEIREKAVTSAFGRDPDADEEAHGVQSLTPVMRSQSRAPLPVDKDEAGNFETPLNSQ